MADPTTANIQLFQPTRGSDTGVWDVPMNGNTSILDLVLGGVATIPLNNANVTLSASQYESKTITFVSTLTGSVTITFPTSFIKSYEVFNSCTGSSAFTITLNTTAASSGAAFICAPPGEAVTVLNDGANLKYVNLGRIGTYADFAVSTIPNWISGCSSPLPYLNCDGSVFNAATYPALNVILGGNTLPDTRGRGRFALDQGTGRNTGVFSQLVGFGAGNQLTTLGTSNLPAYTPSGSIANQLGGSFTLGLEVGGGPPQVAYGGGASGAQAGSISVTGTFTGNAQGGTSAPFSNVPPGYIGGLTLIRAG